MHKHTHIQTEFLLASAWKEPRLHHDHSLSNVSIASFIYPPTTHCYLLAKIELNSVDLVSKRTTLTERLPLASEVVPNFAVRGVSRGQRQRIPTAVNLGFLD
jgi:hypothetical protein